MCLIAFAWRPGEPMPLLLMANRDEFHSRPCHPAARWPDGSGIIAGQDLQQGGTWLGLGPEGRFAALTNIRDPAQPEGKYSRGELVTHFLRSRLSPQEWLQQLQAQLADYSGFNLLLGSARELWHFNSREQRPNKLAPGLYGLSNASLNTPWPKVLTLRSELARLQDLADNQQLLHALRNREQAQDDALPDTGIGLEWERRLSSVFITGIDYGTRCSTIVKLYADGNSELCEQSFEPQGKPAGLVHLTLSAIAVATD
ncbi:MAG: NRDE family protein [Enterobacteriaceae bacterium]